MSTDSFDWRLGASKKNIYTHSPDSSLAFPVIVLIVFTTDQQYYGLGVRKLQKNQIWTVHPCVVLALTNAYELPYGLSPDGEGLSEEKHQACRPRENGEKIPA